MEEKNVKLISIEEIVPNRFQPRQIFGEKELNELADSIKEHGIIQPLIVRPLGDKYEIIAGERRYKASYIAGLTKVPAIIIDLNDNESAEVAIVENIQRKNLSPIEEAKSYKKLLDRGYLTQDELASRMGKTQGSISNKLRLLNLSKDVQDALLNNQISERHARSLLKLTNEDEQVEILNRIMNERLNVRETENLINSYINNEEYIPVSNITEIKTEIKTEPSLNFDSFFDKPKEKVINNVPMESLRNINEEREIETINDEPIMIEENDESKRDILQEKVKEFINSLKEEGFVSTYDSYEFDKLYEFIIKIEK